ncbi:hypothetical protein K435DRAFT_594815, partial [Dendrothele bispora CBS 962.96]
IPPNQHWTSYTYQSAPQNNRELPREREGDHARGFPSTPSRGNGGLPGNGGGPPSGHPGGNGEFPGNGGGPPSGPPGEGGGFPVNGGGPPSGPPGGNGGFPGGDPPDDPGSGNGAMNNPHPPKDSGSSSWQFNPKISTSIIPSWDGEGKNLIDYIITMNKIAEKSEQLSQGLAVWALSKWSAKAKDWWEALSLASRQYLR